jgi:hypothetical protein
MDEVLCFALVALVREISPPKSLDLLLIVVLPNLCK